MAFISDKEVNTLAVPAGVDSNSMSGLEVQPSSNGTRRGPRLVVAAATVVALAVGAVALHRAGWPELESTADTGRSSVQTGEAGGVAVDRMLVDYVFPVNGDDWVAAKVRFGVAAARAKSASVGRCVRERGHPGAEALLIEYAEEVGMAVVMDLPSLAVISRYWGGRVSPLDSSERFAALDCKGIDHSEASEWEDDAKGFRSVEHLPPAIAKVETTPVWTAARHCMTEAGAPDDAPEAQRAELERMADEIGEALSNPPPEFNAYVSWIYDLPSAKAFVWCMTPFFAEVERLLVGPRAEFIERHREKLLELQRRFEVFAGPGG